MPQLNSSNGRTFRFDSRGGGYATLTVSADIPSLVEVVLSPDDVMQLAAVINSEFQASLINLATTNPAEAERVRLRLFPTPEPVPAAADVVTETTTVRFSKPRARATKKKAAKKR